MHTADAPPPADSRDRHVPAAVAADEIGDHEDPQEMLVHFPGRAGGESAEAGKGGGRFVVRLAVISGAVRRREDVKQVVDEFLVVGFRESA